MLERAGFDLLVDEVLTLALDAPLDERARRFSHEQLRRMRMQLGHADPAAVELLDVLIDPDDGDGILHRDDVGLRASRRLLIAKSVSN
jgi:hypothetical protein